MKTSRRSFLGGVTAVAGLAPFVGFPAVVKRRSPNSLLSHACVGTGN
ncbi:MAG: twin-arginine translocation signal domain-containing protein, partial [Lentisphaerae bacterium]|nr:twin-arginine translocation signal domain-containing protein [Lentisphaerota bacterium]